MARGAYRGPVTGRHGHDGRRDGGGRFAPYGVIRHRASLALKPEAQAVLQRLAKAHDLYRCELLELLLLDPHTVDVIERRLAKLCPKPGADKQEGPTLQEQVEALCRAHGEDWPRGAAARLAKRFQTSRQAVHNRKVRTLAKGRIEAAKTKHGPGEIHQGQKQGDARDLAAS